jgi:hypothetical protein
MGGSMKRLPLSGQAITVAGMASAHDRIVLRFRAPSATHGKPHHHDAALVRNAEDAAMAQAAGFQMA